MNIQLPNNRITTDWRAVLTLKESGVLVDWSTLDIEQIFMLSDAQDFAFAGLCEYTVDEDQPTKLHVVWNAKKQLFLGIHRVVAQVALNGVEKTYDKRALNVVPLSDSEATVYEIDETEVELEVSEISTAIIAEILAACQEATRNANAIEELASTNEAQRILNEAQRISDESARQTAETARQTAEAARVAAEKARVIAEEGRVEREAAIRRVVEELDERKADKGRIFLDLGVLEGDFWPELANKGEGAYLLKNSGIDIYIIKSKSYGGTQKSFSFLYSDNDEFGSWYEGVYSSGEVTMHQLATYEQLMGVKETLENSLRTKVNVSTFNASISTLTNDIDDLNRTKVDTGNYADDQERLQDQLAGKADTDYVNTELAKKQDKLIPGSGIVIAADGKTISATGGGGGGSTTIVDNLDSDSATSALSARQGKVLKGLVDGKQDTIADVDTIRSNASKGATAVQPSAISDMETKTHAGQTYQPKGDYATTTLVNAKYTKPSNGIPSTDLAQAVRDTLAKVDEIYQDYIDANNLI